VIDMEGKYKLSVNIPTFGMVEMNFLGVSRKVIDLYDLVNEFHRQRSIKHLGLISEVFDSVSHTRFDYIMLQCMIVDIFEKFHTSESLYNLGSLKLNGISEYGHSILKSWFLLSNFGHTKHTIGDEKALAYFFINDKQARKTLIEKIKDNGLKKYAKKVISSFDYMKLHYLLGIARVYEEVSSNNLKRDIIELYKILLLDEEELAGKYNYAKLSDLRIIYEKIRDLSIIAIDSHYSHVPFSISLLNAAINLNKDNNYENEFINSILGALNKDLYLNRNVICIQQTYINSALNTLKSNNDLGKIIFKDVFSEGLVVNMTEDYKILTRITLKDSMRISNDILYYMEYLKGIVNEEALVINVDENKYFQEIYIDFFVKKDLEKSKLPQLLFSIFEFLEEILNDMLVVDNSDTFNFVDEIENLKEEISLTDEKLEKIKALLFEPIFHKIKSSYLDEIIQLYEVVFWDIIDIFIKSNFKIVVNKNNVKYKHFDVRLKNQNILNNNISIKNAKKALSNDPDRVHEINQLEYSLKRAHDGYSLYLIERATVFDTNQPPNKRKATDIDSLILMVSKEKIIIEFNESKNTRKPEKDALKDLRRTFVKVLSKEAKGYRTKEVKKFGAKVVLKIE
jgi:hypothetical protein